MESIFVSIASYKDSDINSTILDCFERASHPERVWVGLFLQDEERVTEDFKLWLEGFKWKSQIILKTSTTALGCGWARNVILNELYNDSDYFLCIDSHSRFINDWDDKYIKLYSNIPTFGVISVFPLPYEFGQTYEDYTIHDMVPNIYIPNAPVWDEDFRTPHCIYPVNELYKKVITISGGNLFGPGSMVEVLKLPNWEYNPTFEQEIYSFLLFKAGYDIYATNQNIIFHKYAHKDETPYRERVHVNHSNYINDFVSKLKTHGESKRTHYLWLSEYYKVCDECTKIKENEENLRIG